MLLVKAIERFKSYLKNTDKAEETIKGYMIQLKHLNRFLTHKYNGPVYMQEITIQDLEDYMNESKSEGKAASSRNRSVYIIRAFYDFCFKKEYILNNISVKLEPVPITEKERTFLTPDEMEILISAVAHPFIRLILTTLFYTGMRISECLNLSLQDVNLKEGIISVKHTKNKKDRRIPIHRSLLPLLAEYLEKERKGKASTYFFASNRQNRVSPDYVNRILRETTYRLKWEKKVTCHIIRHSFASSLVAKNVNVVKIQKLLGHSDLATTSIYTHTNISELVDAVNSI